MNNKIYQLKVTLLHSNPLIWRTILVYADTNLNDLHRILQTTMGWTNSHLHEFSDGKHSYSPAEVEVEGNRLSDSVKLSKLMKRKMTVLVTCMILVIVGRIASYLKRYWIHHKRNIFQPALTVRDAALRKIVAECMDTKNCSKLLKIPGMKSAKK